MDTSGLKNFFEEIDRYGYYRKGRINYEDIFSRSPEDLLEHINYFGSVTATDLLVPEKCAFAFSSSIGLGAGRIPCVALPCRLRHANELSQFAALYSDRVYIPNFLTQLQGYDLERSEDLRIFYDYYIDDIEILMHLRNFIEEGIIVPYTPPHICPNCTIRRAFGNKAEQLLRHEKKELKKRLFRETQIKLEWDGESYCANFEGPEYLLEHKNPCVTFTNPSAITKLANIPRLINRLHKGEIVKLSAKQRKMLDLEDDFIIDILSDISNAVTSQGLGVPFLTNREIHTDLLNKLSGNEFLSHTNQIVRKYLTSIVPFIAGVSPKDLLKIRRREEDSFLIYRRALREAISEYLKNKDTFNDIQAKEIYGDILAPQLALLEKKVREAKKDIMESVGRKFLGLAGAISFGVYSGMFPYEIIAVASSLGLMKVIKDLIEETVTRSDLEKNIRQDKMYFLWKVQRTAKTKLNN